MAAVTCFYTAVKVYERIALDVGTLMEICRGSYAEDNITTMEKDILEGLGWRVSVFTPMDFVRTMLELLSADEVPPRVRDCLIRGCQEHIDRAVADVYFSRRRPGAVVGTACLAAALTECDVIPPLRKLGIWTSLSERCNFDISSDEVLEAQDRLLSGAIPTENGRDASNAVSSSEVPENLSAKGSMAVAHNGVNEGESPKSVMKAAA